MGVKREILCSNNDCVYNHNQRCTKRKLRMGYFGLVKTAVCLNNYKIVEKICYEIRKEFKEKNPKIKKPTKTK